MPKIVVSFKNTEEELRIYNHILKQGDKSAYIKDIIKGYRKLDIPFDNNIEINKEVAKEQPLSKTETENRIETKVEAKKEQQKQKVPVTEDNKEIEENKTAEDSKVIEEDKSVEEEKAVEENKEEAYTALNDKGGLLGGSGFNMGKFTKKK